MRRLVPHLSLFLLFWKWSDSALVRHVSLCLFVLWGHITEKLFHLLTQSFLDLSWSLDFSGNLWQAVSNFCISHFCGHNKITDHDFVLQKVQIHSKRIGNKFIHLKKGKCIIKFCHCALFSNKRATHRCVKYTGTCIKMFYQSSIIAKIRCHLRNAILIHDQHESGWVLCTLHPHVFGECDSFILLVQLESVRKTTVAEKSKTRAGWLVDQRGDSKPSSSSAEVNENLLNSSWLMEGIRGSSIGVSVGSSWVKSGSKLLTSSGVFWIRIMINYSLAATADTTAEGLHYHSHTWLSYSRDLQSWAWRVAPVLFD